jgi:hypothetical protein
MTHEVKAFNPGQSTIGNRGADGGAVLSSDSRRRVGRVLGAFDKDTRGPALVSPYWKGFLQNKAGEGVRGLTTNCVNQIRGS